MRSAIMSNDGLSTRPEAPVSGEVPLANADVARSPDPKTPPKFEEPYVSRERNTMPVRGLGLK